MGSCIHVFGPDKQLEVPKGQSILESLSDKRKADMASRYNLSKLMMHLCFNEMAREESLEEKGAKGQVIFNLVNPGWCSTELSRSRPTNGGEKAAFVVFGRTGEEGGRTLVHAITAGRETHKCYLSECKVKEQSAFVRSDRGKKIAREVWKETKARIDSIQAAA